MGSRIEIEHGDHVELESYVRLGGSVWLRAVERGTGEGGGDSKMLLAMTSEQATDLALALLEAAGGQVVTQ